MRIRHFALFASMIVAAVATVTSAARSATEGIARFASAAFLYAVNVIASPATWRSPFTPALAFGGPAPHYDAPPVHSLRHEAGTPRRAADRHV